MDASFNGWVVIGINALSVAGAAGVMWWRIGYTEKRLDNIEKALGIQNGGDPAFARRGEWHSNAQRITALEARVEAIHSRGR